MSGRVTPRPKSSSKASSHALLLVVGLAAAVMPAAGQEPRERGDTVAVIQPDEPRVRPERTLVPAALGSAAGATLGFMAGVGTGIGGGDDPGLLGGLVFGLAGSVLGTAAGVELGSGGRADFRSALGASVAGIFGGAALAWAAGAAFDDDAYVFVGYAVGQATVASLLSAVLSDIGP